MSVEINKNIKVFMYIYVIFIMIIVAYDYYVKSEEVKELNEFMEMKDEIKGIECKTKGNKKELSRNTNNYEFYFGSHKGENFKLKFYDTNKKEGQTIFFNLDKIIKVKKL